LSYRTGTASEISDLKAPGMNTFTKDANTEVRQSVPPVRSVEQPEYMPPIHQLPDEILLQIIQWGTKGQKWPIKALLVLGQVCQRWRRVVDEPILWSRIDASDGLVLIRTALKKAQGTPLDLVYTHRTKGLSMQDFFREVESQIDQWDSLVVEAERLAGLCTPIEILVPPRLRKLCMSKFDEWGASTTKMRLFGGRPAPPSLKDVSFTYIDPVLPNLRLAGVTSLELCDVSGPSEADFVAILQSSPALARIRLVSMWFEPSGALGQTLWVNPIRLGALVALSAIRICLDNLHFILSCIDGPALQTFEVHAEMDEWQSSLTAIFDSNTKRLLTPLKHAISTAKEIKVSFWADCDVTISVGGFELGVGYQSSLPSRPIIDHFRESVNWLRSHVDCDIRDCSVHLELQNTYLDPEISQWLTSSVTVHKLTLLGTTFAAYRPAVDVLHALLFSHTSPGSPVPLPCLEVITMEIMENDDLHRITQCIQDVVYERKQSTEGVPTIVHLRELRLSAYHDDPNFCSEGPPVPRYNELLRNIRQATGDLQIYWEGKEWDDT
ncbi:hypothetical protein FRB90_006283, partial [Tulasnella sp. 427]